FIATKSFYFATLPRQSNVRSRKTVTERRRVHGSHRGALQYRALSPSPCQGDGRVASADAAATTGRGRSQARRQHASGAQAPRALVRPAVRLAAPVPPVRRVHFETLLGRRIHPAAENAPTGEHQHMRADAVDDGKLEIMIERRARDRLPHARSVAGVPACALT